MLSSFSASYIFSMAARCLMICMLLSNGVLCICSFACSTRIVLWKELVPLVKQFFALANSEAWQVQSVHYIYIYIYKSIKLNTMNTLKHLEICIFDTGHHEYPEFPEPPNSSRHWNSPGMKLYKLAEIKCTGNCFNTG